MLSVISACLRVTVMMVVAVVVLSSAAAAQSEVWRGDVQDRLLQKAAENAELNLRKAKIDNAFARRRSVLAAGGFMGFIVWILLFINTVITCVLLVGVLFFIGRNRAFPKDLIARVQKVLHDGELGFALETCVPSKTPLARILFEAFKNIGEGFEACKDAMEIAVKAEHEKLLKPIRSLISCAASLIGLGVLGCGLGIYNSLSVYSVNTSISARQELAYTLGQSFFPLLVGVVAGCIAFFMYHHALGKVNRIIINTEKIAYDLVKVLRGAHVEGGLPDMSTMTQLLNYNSIKNIPPVSRK
ncbi:MotA/TolQ/ExbB proton channel family protein [Lentisphaerota bacterium ZTH]|nr:MotA/TolQ/ExbB proton channel family protein [Lentisphaerota bacterium]WET06889.1 MotA/TolQ/ExbB proton channel family protein [Lentisphaerota bacterium ZTH]